MNKYLQRVNIFDLDDMFPTAALQRELSNRADALSLCAPSDFYSLELVFATWQQVQQRTYVTGFSRYPLAAKHMNTIAGPTDRNEALKDTPYLPGTKWLTEPDSTVEGLQWKVRRHWADQDILHLVGNGRESDIDNNPFERISKPQTRFLYGFLKIIFSSICFLSQAVSST